MGPFHSPKNSTWPIACPLWLMADPIKTQSFQSLGLNVFCSSFFFEFVIITSRINSNWLSSLSDKWPLMGLLILKTILVKYYARKKKLILNFLAWVQARIRLSIDLYIEPAPTLCYKPGLGRAHSYTMLVRGSWTPSPVCIQVRLLFNRRGYKFRLKLNTSNISNI